MMRYTWSLAKPMSQFLRVLSIESKILSEFFYPCEWYLRQTKNKKNNTILFAQKNCLAENQPIVYELKKQVLWCYSIRKVRNLCEVSPKSNPFWPIMVSHHHHHHQQQLHSSVLTKWQIQFTLESCSSKYALFYCDLWMSELPTVLYAEFWNYTLDPHL